MYKKNNKQCKIYKTFENKKEKNLRQVQAIFQAFKTKNYKIYTKMYKNKILANLMIKNKSFCIIFA